MFCFNHILTKVVPANRQLIVSLSVKIQLPHRHQRCLPKLKTSLQVDHLRLKTVHVRRREETMAAGESQALGAGQRAPSRAAAAERRTTWKEEKIKALFVRLVYMTCGNAQLS